ncbi:MAG: hypothetical protein NTY34_02320 [Candidatus Omnitrophica bacterium]|nr:hypothetical protein [Candidatus Omnitrophota bacterium]
MAKDETAYNVEASSGKIKESQGALDRELLAIEAWLDELGHDADVVNAKLREAKAHKPAIKQEPKTAMPEEYFEAQLEKLLQGSLEHLGDRLSQRILDMLKDLKEVEGPARETKLKELKAAVDDEVVDLSGLFTHDKLESSINEAGEAGIDEKESKGTKKILNSLRTTKNKYR